MELLSLLYECLDLGVASPVDKAGLDLLWGGGGSDPLEGFIWIELAVVELVEMEVRGIDTSVYHY